MDNVRRKHLSFRKTRIKMLVSEQVAETCDACDRTEDLRVLRFSIYADFYSDRKSIKTDKTIKKYIIETHVCNFSLKPIDRGECKEYSYDRKNKSGQNDLEVITWRLQNRKMK